MDSIESVFDKYKKLLLPIIRKEEKEKDIDLELEVFDAVDGKKYHGKYSINIKYNREYETQTYRNIQRICFFTIVQLPGCCGVLISTGAYVSPEFRNLGIGTILNNLRKEIAKKVLGYSLLLCTNRMDNRAQQTILRKNGWEKIHTFKNSRTDNKIAIHVVQL